MTLEERWEIETKIQEKKKEKPKEKPKEAIESYKKFYSDGND